jgi:hypothetical protein
MAQNKKKILLKIIAHVLVWLVVFAVPFLLAPKDDFKFDIFPRTLESPLLFAVIIFYINYFLLIDRFLLKKKYLYFYILNILLILFIVVFLDILRPLSMPGPHGMDNKNFPGDPPGEPRNPMFFMFAFKDILTLIIPLIFSIALKVTRKLVNTENERQQIEKENIQSTLMLLKYQVQPHFFFNSLNNIYSLIEASPAKAQEALYNLGKLMRYTLYEKDFVTLGEEIGFLKKYILLMGLRLHDNVRIEVLFPEDPDRHVVVPFLFIPLIENAYKHGISSSEPSVILIKMTLKNDHIHFQVDNTYFPKDRSDKSGSGIGLQNLMQRLELIYPGRYEFSKTIENGMFRVSLVIDVSAF